MYKPADTTVIHTEQRIERTLPANVTYRDLIRANKRKSTLLVIGMCLLMIALGAAIAALLSAWGGGMDMQVLIPALITGAGAGLVTAIIVSMWSYYGGSQAVLRMSNAVELPPQRDPQLYNVVEELSIAAGVPMPKIFVINSSALNAFATGRDPEHGVVAITTGLRSQLSRDELAGVMAHELSHIRNYDIRLAMLMATMVGVIVFAADATWRTILRGGMYAGSSRRGSSKGGGNPAALIILAIALLLAVIAPALALLIRFAISRQREFLADAGAVELTRYPQGMIGALQKLGASQTPLKEASRATAHMFIVNPLKNAAGKHDISSVFRTHPPLNDRIARLRALIE